MGFSVKCYSTIIFSVCCEIFQCLLFLEKILLNVWRVFRGNTIGSHSLLAL